MKSKLLWVLLICATVAALVATSCSPAAGETATQTEIKGTISQLGVSPVPATKTQATTTVPVTKPSANDKTPVYGGVLTTTQAADTTTFDDCYTWSASSASWSVNITNDELFDGDWSAGPEGRGETTWLLYKGWDGMENFEKGFGLAESWEVDEQALTFTFHIRKGARWAVNSSSPAAKLVNGREVTADDVIASFNRQWSVPVSFFFKSYTINKPISMTAPDKYTVVFKYDVLGKLTNTLLDCGDMVHIWPKEAMTAYNNDLRDWTLSVGSGAFILKDYVRGSSATYVKNPDYWKTYNVPGPGFGKQLPFVDGLKVLVIPDKSTRMAALRTGKVDQSMGYTYEDYLAMKKSNPELKDAFYWDNNAAIFFKVDNAAQPWSNLKVRQALMMATDLNSIIRDFYSGHAENYTNTTSMPEYKDIYIPVKSLPANVQELYSYNPDKAKQLLKDAGFATGFTANIVTNSTFTDLLSIVKDNWAKVGVTLNLDNKEITVYNSISTAKTETELICRSQSIALAMLYGSFRTGSQSNRVSDPKIDAAWKAVWATTNWTKRCQIFKDSYPYILEQVYIIPLPAFETHTLWEPWIMGYQGEYGTGNSDLNTFAQYVWLNQDMREAKTGTR